MSELKVKRFKVPTKGWNTQGGPFSLSSDYAPVLANFLVHRDGSLPMRGDLAGEVVVTNAIPVVGSCGRNKLWLTGLVERGFSPGAMPWVCAYQGGSQIAHNASDVTNVYDFNGSGLTLSDTHSFTAGPQVLHIGDDYYMTTLTDAGASLTQVGGGSRSPTTVTRVDSGVTHYANAPHGAVGLAYHLNRLFVIGCSEPTGGSVHPLRLCWSDQFADSVLPDTNAAWQDDATGLTNQIILDGDTRDAGQALAVVGQNLLIFRRESTDILLGSTPSTFQVRRLFDHGCLDPRTIVPYDDGIIFLSRKGLIWTDGASVTVLSGNVQNALLTAVQTTVGNRSVPEAACASVSLLGDDYIAVSVGLQSLEALALSGEAWFSAICHVPTRRWSALTSDVMAGDAPVLWLGKMFHFAFCTAREPVNDEYEVFSGRVTSVDRFYIPDTNTVDILYTSDANSDGTIAAPIPSKWITPATSLSGPAARSQLRRMLVTSKTTTAGNVANTDAWSVSVHEPNNGAEGSTSLATLTTQRETFADPDQNAPGYDRDTVDSSRECDVVYVQAEWAGEATRASNVKSELYDCFVEYQTSHQTLRRS